MEKNTKVMLLVPNQRWVQKSYWSLHPYTIASLMSTLKDEFQLAFIDANIDNLTIEQTTQKILEFKPDVLGVSVLSNAYRDAAFQIISAVKKISPNITTVMGGVFVTTRPRKALSCKDLDYGVIGEGEYIFPELIKYITNQKDKLPSEGIAYRANGEIIVKPQVTFISDLDSLPPPDYTFIDYNKYTHDFRKSVDAPRALPFGKIISSRGCPIGCVFCQVEYISGKTTRSKSVEKTIEEIQFLIDNYGIKAIEFEDDNLLGNRKRAKELFRKMAEKNWDLIWNAMNVSSFYLDEEMLDLMKASKCQYISIAVESGSPRVLKEIIKKPVNLEHTGKMVSYARKLGIDTTSLYVIGFPGETWQEIRQTIKFAEDINTDYIKINVATAFPGTKLHKLALETKSIDSKFDYDDYEWGKAGISTDEFNAGQLTILRIMEWDRINFSTPEKVRKIAKMMNISVEELQEVRKSTRDGINYFQLFK